MDGFLSFPLPDCIFFVGAIHASFQETNLQLSQLNPLFITFLSE
jgi:hypothetical protein